MIGARIVLKRGSRDEAEKPFWISYADLMTALSVLFLVCMSAVLIAVTKTVDEQARRETERNNDISELRKRLREAAQQFDGITVQGDVINFGSKATFEFKEHRLTTEQAQNLRAFMPVVLNLANTNVGKKVA